MRVLAEGGLGGPRPTALRATTRNSYSTQALSPTTAAVSVLPLTNSGTAGGTGTRERDLSLGLGTGTGGAEEPSGAESSGEVATCVHRLPAHGEGRASLDDVAGDGAAVVSPRAPGELGGAVRHLLHRHSVGGARRTCRGEYNPQFVPCALENVSLALFS